MKPARVSICTLKGYIIQEIIVGLIIFGIAVLPILRGLMLLPEVATAVSQQARAEAWRGANEQSVSNGIDPVNTGLMQDLADPSRSGTIARQSSQPRAGAPLITMLDETFSETAEERSVAAGIEVGASSIALPPRADPLPPLLPVVLRPPSLSPSNGTFVAVSSLLDAGAPGSPFVTSVSARGADPADFVQLRQTSPRVQTAQGKGGANLNVDGWDLAQASQGQAWSEYAGNVHADVAAPLDDGRTAWVVMVGDRAQIFQPSEFVDFVYGLDLGRPVYRVGNVDFASGSTVVIDYFLAHKIDAGNEPAQITYSRDVQSRLGRSFASIEPNYAWSFGTRVGDSDRGNTASLFSAEGRRGWAEDQLLSAAPFSELKGLKVGTASWTVERRATRLDAPVRIGNHYDGETDEIGLVTFGAPIISDLGGRVGRPSLNNIESVSETLEVPIIP